MTKRQRLTVDQVLEDMLSDDEDYDNPDEPMIDGSDDDFSDLEMDERDDNMYDPMDHDNPPGSSTVSGSPTHSVTPTPSSPSP